MHHHGHRRRCNSLHLRRHPSPREPLYRKPIQPVRMITHSASHLPTWCWVIYFLEIPPLVPLRVAISNDVNERGRTIIQRPSTPSAHTHKPFALYSLNSANFKPSSLPAIRLVGVPSFADSRKTFQQARGRHGEPWHVHNRIARRRTPEPVVWQHVTIISSV